MTDRLTAAEYRALGQKKPRRHKYGAKAAFREACGAAAETGVNPCRQCQCETVRRFDSKAEAARFDDLRLLERAGDIAELRCQVPFPIVVNGVEVGSYVADFEYCRGVERIIEDVKGGSATKTAVYRLKKRLVEALYGVQIREVM